MNHVNVKHSQWGLLGLLWTLLAGAFVIILAYAIHGTFLTDDFEQLIDKLQKTSFIWVIGILELVVVVGSLVGLILLSKRISKLPAPKGAGVLRVVPLILSKVCQRGLTG
ncbi:MAG: hypothetical protein QGH39_05545 [Candidatus Thermoplasmatota archaeon]|jgi:hypothetical protein|nr:hypothetical protein [Candidatus Thermoplasmatota archaeon]